MPWKRQSPMLFRHSHRNYAPTLPRRRLWFSLIRICSGPSLLACLPICLGAPFAQSPIPAARNAGQAADGDAGERGATRRRLTCPCRFFQGSGIRRRSRRDVRLASAKLSDINETVYGKRADRARRSEPRSAGADFSARAQPVVSKVRKQVMAASRRAAPVRVGRERSVSCRDHCTLVIPPVIPRREAMNHTYNWPVAKYRPFFLARQMTLYPRGAQWKVCDDRVGCGSYDLGERRNFFLAHAIEGYSAHPHAELRQGRVPKSSMIWASIETGR